MSRKLFYDDEFDALSQMISNSDREFKEVAAFLFPDLPQRSQYSKLKACLNPLGDERLKPGQVLAAMNFCGQYDPLYHQCDETLHARPPRIAPEDEQVKLVETIESATREMKSALAALDRMRDRKPNVRAA